MDNLDSPEKSLSSWPQTLCFSARTYNIFLQPQGCFFPLSYFPSSCSSFSVLQQDPEPTCLGKKRQDLLVGTWSECQNQHCLSPRGDLQQIGLELGSFLSDLRLSAFTVGPHIETGEACVHFSFKNSNAQVKWLSKWCIVEMDWFSVQTGKPLEGWFCFVTVWFPSPWPTGMTAI